MSINDYQPDNALDLVHSGHVDAVQVIYNAFHQAPLGAELLRVLTARPAAAGAGAGAGNPVRSG
jgi:hypothetical protein